MGGSNNDTLWGGAGSDYLTGGAGSDVFIYQPNEGTDRITDFTADDMLMILTGDGTQGPFSDSTFKNSKLTLTIDGGGTVVLQNVSETQTFNINGTSYSVSNGKLE